MLSLTYQLSINKVIDKDPTTPQQRCYVHYLVKYYS